MQGRESVQGGPPWLWSDLELVMLCWGRIRQRWGVNSKDVT